MKEINNYKLWIKKPNTIVKGARVYTKTIHFETKNKFKERLIRVYLPSTYDFEDENKRFPVLYMFDGKNLFDDYTSYVGEWKVDEIVESFIKEKLIEGLIVVGVDAPNDDLSRTLEMSLSEIQPLKRTTIPERGYLNLLGDFVFKVVKPDIDSSFHTLAKKENTGIAGSSMGGLAAFYMAVKYKKYLAYSLCFSPAFFLYDGKDFIDNFIKPNLKGLPKLYFFVGGKGFESWFVRHTIKVYYALRKAGYLEDRLIMQIDTELEHNERTWSKYLPEALKFAFNIKRV